MLINGTSQKSREAETFVHQPYDQNYNHRNTYPEGANTALLMQSNILIYSVEYHHGFFSYYINWFLTDLGHH